MKLRSLGLNLALWVLPVAALAAQGLVAPTADALWPQWRARIAVQTAAVTPISLAQPLDNAAPQRGLQGGSVLGDYNFASPAFGTFRASGGVMFGAQGGTSLLAAAAGPRLGLSVYASGNPQPAGSETPAAMAYLGFGFSGAAWRQTLSITADVGMVAGHPGAAGSVGRAIFGNQGMDSALRELRLSPMLQLGMRYNF